MKRLYNLHNFVQYRINFFNDFLALYTLYRSHSNWKFFLKKRSLLNINIFSKTTQSFIFKKKLFNSFLLNNFFLFRIRFLAILKVNEYAIILNYLKMSYLVQILRCSNTFIIALNSFIDFNEIYTFLRYLQTKLITKDSILEISNIAFRLFPVSLLFSLIFFQKYGYSFALLKTILFVNFFAVGYSLVLVEIIFMRLIEFIYYLIIFQFMFFLACINKRIWLR